MEFLKNIWEQVSNLGVTDKLNETERTKVRQINKAVFFGCFAIIFLITCIYIPFQIDILVTPSLVLILFLVAGLISNWYQRITTTIFILNTSVIVVILWIFIESKGELDTYLLFFPISTSVFFLFSRKQALQFSIFLFLIYLSLVIISFFFRNATSYDFLNSTVTLICFMVQISFLKLFHEENARYSDELVQKDKDLEQAQAIAKMGSWVYNCQTNELIFSEQLYEMLNVEKGTSLDIDISLLSHFPIEHTNYLHHLKATKTAGQFNFIFTYELNDSLKWYQCIGQLSIDISGNGKLLGTVQDISEQVTMEQQLDAERSFIEAAMESTADGILVINNDFSKNRYNNRFLELWGVSHEIMANVKGSQFIDYIKEKLKEPEVFLDKLGHIVANPQQITESILYLKNGKILEQQSQPQILNNEIIGTVWSVRDVTSQKHSEENLRKREAFFRTVLENAYDGFAIYGGNSYTYMSPSIKRILGYSPDEMIGHDALEFMPNDEFLKAKNVIKQLFRSKKENQHQRSALRYIHKDGSTRILDTLSVNRVDDPIINGVLSNFRDITEQVENEQKIKELIKELKEKTDNLETSNINLVQSNKELEQFAYVASHDLQEPLRMVGNFVQLLEEEYGEKLDEEGRSYINFAVDGVSRMSKLIDDLLKYSRIGRRKLDLQKVNINLLVKNILQDLSHKIKDKNAVIETKNLPIALYCEPSHIHMAIFNLVNNALKFNQQTTPKVAIEAISQKNEWLFSVKDNGIGIDMKNKEKIFEIFKRLHRKEEYKGTGIGLSLTKRIVVRHGGKIWLESELGQGTTFYFTIPINTM